MRKRVIITTLVFAMIHLAGTFGLLVYVCGALSDAFDNPFLPTPTIVTVAVLLLDILVQPMMFFADMWRNMPGLAEWVLLISNSILWGLVITLTINIPRMKMVGKSAVDTVIGGQ